MDIPKLLEAIGTFLRILRWRHLAQLTVLVIIAAIGTIGWMDREYISGVVRPAKFSTERLPLIVSNEASAAINETLKKSSFLVNTIGVVSVNMQQNTRRIIYFVTLDPVIKFQQEQFTATHSTTDIPLFNQDEKNNQRIIKMINGEMICVPFADSQAARYLHDVDIKTVCALGVPPYFGEFRGTVMAYIKVVPDAEEQIRVRILLRELSSKLDNPSSGEGK